MKYYIQSRISEDHEWHDEANTGDVHLAQKYIEGLRYKFPNLLYRIFVKEPVEILDMIVHHNAYGYQLFAIISRRPVYQYTRDGDWLVAKDGPFSNSYRYERPYPIWKTLVGRHFDIPLTDGTVEKAYGQWWDATHTSLLHKMHVWYATEEDLKRCYVFTRGSLESKPINEWLSFNEPSNNYNKYRKTSKDYCKHKIVSKWSK